MKNKVIISNFSRNKNFIKTIYILFDNHLHANVTKHDYWIIRVSIGSELRIFAYTIIAVIMCSFSPFQLHDCIVMYITM